MKEAPKGLEGHTAVLTDWGHGTTAKVETNHLKFSKKIVVICSVSDLFYAFTFLKSSIFPPAQQRRRWAQHG